MCARACARVCEVCVYMFECVSQREQVYVYMYGNESICKRESTCKGTCKHVNTKQSNKSTSRI